MTFAAKTFANTLVIVLALGSSACTFLNKKAAAAPPPAPRIIDPPKPKPQPPVQLPGPGPDVQEKIDKVPQPPPVVAETPASVPAPPKPVPPKRRVAKAKKKTEQEAQPAAPAPQQASEAAPAPAAAAPRLGQMLTTQQTEAYNKNLDESLDRVKQALGTVQGRTLTNEQSEVVVRIKSFLVQAEQTRERDLLTAVRLASRADLLSRDLLSQIR